MLRSIAASCAMLLAPCLAVADEVAASFNCKKAATGIEKKICTDAFLGFRDGALGALYKQLRSAKAKIPNIDNTVRQWLRERNALCGRERNDGKLTQCLMRRYDAILAELSRQMEKAGVGPAGRGLAPIAGTYRTKAEGFGGAVTIVEMPDMTVYAEIETVSGRSAHICNLFTGAGRRKGNTVTWRDTEEPKCRMTLQFKGRTVTPKGTPMCRRYYCGANGGFAGFVYRR